MNEGLLKKALERAVVDAIDKMGVAAFRRMSIFMSNSRTDIEIKNAA